MNGDAWLEVDNYPRWFPYASFLALDGLGTIIRGGYSINPDFREFALSVMNTYFLRAIISRYEPRNTSTEVSDVHSMCKAKQVNEVRTILCSPVSFTRLKIRYIYRL